MLRFLEKLIRPKRKFSITRGCGVLIFNNVTLGELKTKLEEFRREYSEATSWDKITVLYDCEFHSIPCDELSQVFSPKETQNERLTN